MKVQLSMLFLALLAGKATAFQAKISEPAQSNATAKSLASQLYGFHTLSSQTVKIGSCSLQPVAGCQCGYCTLLRNAEPTR